MPDEETLFGQIVEVNSNGYVVRASNGAHYLVKAAWDRPALKSYLGRWLRFRVRGEEVVSVQRFGCTLKPNNLCSYCYACRILV